MGVGCKQVVEDEGASAKKERRTVGERDAGGPEKDGGNFYEEDGGPEGGAFAGMGRAGGAGDEVKCGDERAEGDAEEGVEGDVLVGAEGGVDDECGPEGVERLGEASATELGDEAHKPECGEDGKGDVEGGESVAG